MSSILMRLGLVLTGTNLDLLPPKDEGKGSENEDSKESEDEKEEEQDEDGDDEEDDEEDDER